MSLLFGLHCHIPFLLLLITPSIVLLLPPSVRPLHPPPPPLAFLRCLVAVYGEEGVRQREEGWFMMKAHDAAFIDVNFTHLPSILNYPEHFELTIYMIPSRCTYELCSAARVRLTPQGSIQSTPTLPPYPPNTTCMHTYIQKYTYIHSPSHH